MEEYCVETYYLRINAGNYALGGEEIK